MIESNSTNPGPEVAFLWESQAAKGLLLKLPAGFEGEIISEGDVMHAVVITGKVNYIMPQTEEVKSLDSGSYFGASAKAVHTIKSTTREVQIYVRTNGGLSLKG